MFSLFLDFSVHLVDCFDCLCEFTLGVFFIGWVVDAFLIPSMNQDANNQFKSGETRRFLWKFPIRSYVKLSSAVAAILVGVLKCRTQIWKRTTQESFQQSLVEIGSVVSEKNFFLISSPLFSNLHNRSKSVKVQSS